MTLRTEIRRRKLQFAYSPLVLTAAQWEAENRPEHLFRMLRNASFYRLWGIAMACARVTAQRAPFRSWFDSLAFARLHRQPLGACGIPSYEEWERLRARGSEHTREACTWDAVCSMAVAWHHQMTGYEGYESWAKILLNASVMFADLGVVRGRRYPQTPAMVIREMVSFDEAEDLVSLEQDQECAPIDPELRLYPSDAPRV